MLVQRLLEVWRSAANGHISEQVLAELSSYTFDPDPSVARTAMSALDDLELLRAYRAEAAAEGSAGEALGPWIEDAAEDPPRDPADPEQVSEEQQRWEATGLTQRLAQVLEAPTTELRVAVHELWRFAADIRGPGLSESAIAELERLADSERDPGTAERLRAAVRDLRHLAGERARQAEPRAADSADLGLEDQAIEADAQGLADSFRLARDAEAVDSLLRVFAQEQESKAQLNVLAAVGGYEPETAVYLAVQGLQDSDATLRHGLVQQLWRRAADGHGDPADVMNGLERASRDPDPRVREAALAALDDLERLAIPSPLPPEE